MLCISQLNATKGRVMCVRIRVMCVRIILQNELIIAAALWLHCMSMNNFLKPIF